MHEPPRGLVILDILNGSWILKVTVSTRGDPPSTFRGVAKCCGRCFFHGRT